MKGSRSVNLGQSPGHSSDDRATESSEPNREIALLSDLGLCGYERVLLMGQKA